jgi:RHS repeat-associated protein
VATFPFPEAFDYPRDKEDSYVIYENGNPITQRSSITDNSAGNSDDYDLWSQSWVGSYAAVPVCASGFSPHQDNGTILCYNAGSRPTASPDCEGADGDSPKSAPPRKCVGNPIAIDSGAKQHLDTDYSTADGLLAVSRKYRSNGRPGNLSDAMTEIPGFGSNWLGLIPGRITISNPTRSRWTVEFLNDEGGTRRFTFIDSGTGYVFAASKSSTPTRLKLTSTQPITNSIESFVNVATNPNGPGHLRLSYTNGDYLVFRASGVLDAASQTRHFVPIEHGLANGYKRFFEYIDEGQHPSKVKDSLGREMAISWSEIGWVSTTIRGLSKGPNQSAPPTDMTREKAVSALILPDGTRMAYTYGASSSSGFLGRLETTTRLDALNNVLWGRNYLYEDTRFLSAMTGIRDQNGARLSTYAYDAMGRAILTERTGGFDKQKVSYSSEDAAPDNYDQPVDVREITNPNGLKTRYRYSAYTENYSGGESPGPDPRFTPRRLLSMQNDATLSMAARAKKYDYDNDGLLTGGTDANGNSTAQENIVGEGRPTSITDARGTPTQITWHPTLDLPTRTVRKRLQTDYSYDAQGQLTGLGETDLDSNETRGTAFTMAAAGRVAVINGPRVPDTQGRDDITSMAHDAQGNRLTMTNALGHVTRYEGYDANGRAARMIDANGVVTEFSYDELGRLKSTNIKHPTDPTKNAVTAMDYDIEGRVVAITRPDTARINFDYNLAGLMTAIRSDDGERIDYGYDPMGNRLNETVKRADGSQVSSIVRTFDEIGRMLTETFGPGRTHRYEYDKVGNAVRVHTARGGIYENSFDALNRLVATLTPDDAEFDNFYDGDDGPATGPIVVPGANTVVSPGSSAQNELGVFEDGNGAKTRFTRNAFGQVKQEISPDRGTILYEYDASGDMKAMVDGRGQRVEYARDILGRVLAKTPVGRPLTERVTYTYDVPAVTGSASIGRLSRIDDGSGATRFAYDHRGNLLTRFQKLVGTPDWVALRYAYDLGDRIETITYPSGRQARYVRDAKGRVVSVRTRASNADPNWSVLASNMSYEAFGALKTINYGNGERLIITRGDDGRLDGRRLYKVADGINISHLSYGYDVDDNMIRITDKLDATKSLSFAYDPVGRLKRVTAASGPMQRTDYVFDGNGNRLKKLARPLPNDPPTAAVTETYQTSFRSNRLNAITSPAGTRNMSYDARGNLITDTRPGGISIIAGYDGYGRLTSYARTGEASLAHVYNGMDERVASTRGTDTRRFLYAPDGRVLGEYGSTATDVRAEFIWLSPEVGDSGMFGGDDGTPESGGGGYMPLAVAANDNQGISQLAYVHANHMGVPIRYSDASGQTLNPPTSYSVPGFPGQSQTTADLYYNKYRDYDASTGRYVQADPIGLAGGASPYSYAMNNPMRYTDPDGRIVPLVLCGVGALVGAGAMGIGQIITGDFDGTDLLVSAGVGCAAGVVAPVAATSLLGAARFGRSFQRRTIWIIKLGQRL